MIKVMNRKNLVSLRLCAFALGLVASALLIAGGLSQNAHAQLLAYEGFDYDPGDILAVSGGGGGTGWYDLNNDGSDAWIAKGGDAGDYDPDRIFIEDNPPGWGYTDSQGNSLATTGRVLNQTHYETVVRYVDLSAINPGLLANDSNNPLDTVPKLGVDGTSFWISFLGQGTEEQRSANVGIGENHFENVEDGPFGYNRSIFIGRPWVLQPDGSQQLDPIGFNRGWGVLDTGPANVDTVAATGDLYSDKVFLVARIDFHGGNDQNLIADDEKITIWTNPDLGSTAPLDVDAKIKEFSYFAKNFNAIAFGGNADTYFDEIRIGLTYGDVAPIAAPSGGGDFDGDGDVDGADFLKWQTDLGGAADLANWQSEYGTTSGLASATGVPEPSSLLLLGGSLVGLAMRRRAEREGGW